MAPTLPLVSTHLGVTADAACLASAGAADASRVYLVLNPKSFRASIGKLAAQVRSIAHEWGVQIIEGSDPAEVMPVLDRATASGSATVAVIAGDGTVQAIAEHLARISDSSRRPDLLVLAGGRTNLIAADLGGRGDVPKKFATYFRRLASRQPIATQVRHTLAIEQSPAPARHGFFLAAAQVDSAIRACHTYRDSGETSLHKGALSNAYCIAKLGVARTFGSSPFPLMPTLHVNAHELGSLHRPTRLFAASTLLYDQGLLNPFARRGIGALRVTAVAGDAQRFWLRLPRVLVGRFTASMNTDAGYLSGSTGCVEVMGLARYTLDGEKFDCDPTQPVTLRAGPALRFIVP